MGNTFTVLGRHALKRVRRFNIQNRTDRYLEKHKEKPERAPLYEATMKEVERMMKEMPDMTEEMKKKDDSLLKNLNKVYVTSTGQNKDSFCDKRIDSSREARFLQAIKKKGETQVEVPPGKYTMSQATKIIELYQKNPMLNSANALAAKFNLEPSVVAKITKHVKILDYFDTRPKQTRDEKFFQDLIPSSFQGKDETELLQQLQVEADRRQALLWDRASQRRIAERNTEGEALSIKNEDEVNENLLSKKVSDAKEQIYTDLEIYRKTGKLPEGRKLIEGRQIYEDLRIEDIKKLTSSAENTFSPSSDSTEKQSCSDEIYRNNDENFGDKNLNIAEDEKKSISSTEKPPSLTEEYRQDDEEQHGKKPNIVEDKKKATN